MIHPFERRTGQTPLIHLPLLSAMAGANIYMKYDAANPFGSSQDRIGLALIRREYDRGQFRKGGCLVQASSGNTLVAMAHVCSRLGVTLFGVMPKPETPVLPRLLICLGAKVMLTPAEEGMEGALAKAEAVHKDTWISVYPNQFEDDYAVRVHHDGTGSEIAEQCGEIGIEPHLFITGIGTGATLAGVSSRLRESWPDMKTAAVEAAEAPVLSGGKFAPHGLNGISTGKNPAFLRADAVSHIIPVSTTDAAKACRRIIFKEGISCGPTTGANLYAAVQLAARPEYRGKNIIIMGHDGMERHISEPEFRKNLV